MSSSPSSRMHSAEHLLNQAMVRRFSCGRCFSAHINPKKSKCDYHFHRGLTPEEVLAVESEINDIIQKDLQVTVVQMDRQEALQRFDLGRVPNMAQTETFRVVCIGEYDACPCIGEHVSSTAQIGCFAITTTSFEDSVLRIRFKLK